MGCIYKVLLKVLNYYTDYKYVLRELKSLSGEMKVAILNYNVFMSGAGQKIKNAN
jgi:hypothetical protein